MLARLVRGAEVVPHRDGPRVGGPRPVEQRVTAENTLGDPGRHQLSAFPDDTIESASGTQSVNPDAVASGSAISATMAVVRTPASSHARTVNIVSVWELPPASVVTTAPSAPSATATSAAAAAARCLSSAVCS